MKNILITGANGLLGSEFKARLTDEEAWFCGHADLDITDFEAVRCFLKGRKIRYIINCAACRDAEYLEDHPEFSRCCQRKRRGSDSCVDRLCF